MKSHKLAELLLRQPNAEVFVTIDDNENGVAVYQVAHKFDEQKRVVLLRASSGSTVFVPELTNKAAVPHDDGLVFSKSSGKPLL